MGKSQEIKKNDGRKYNKRLAPKPISTKDKMLPKPKTNKSKKERLESRAALAIKNAYGSEQEFLNHLAEQSKKSLGYTKLLMEYRFGKASDSIDDSEKVVSKAPPSITFNVTNNDKQNDNIIDITPED